MSDASTDDLPLTADEPPREGPGGDSRGAARARRDDGDEAVDPPVVACARCDATVVMGARYCPSCGAPLVRSGLQAASGLSRTRRRSSWFVRLVVPLLFLGVVAAIWFVATHDSETDAPSDVESRLGRVVDADRALSARLVALRAADEPDAALRAARAASSTADDVADELADSGVASGQTGRTTRATTAVKANGAYLDAVVAVLRDPDSRLLASLGRRATRAAKALDAADDIVDTQDAIRGTAVLARYVRGRD
jgi:hypothetical protein